jgi:hypothetical protein
MYLVKNLDKIHSFLLTNFYFILGRIEYFLGVNQISSMYNSSNVAACLRYKSNLKTLIKLKDTRVISSKSSIGIQVFTKYIYYRV